MNPLAARRLAGVAFVFVLHIAIALVFLRISVAPIPRPVERSGEIVWLLPPPPTEKLPKPQDETDRGPPAPASTALPDYRGITIPDAAPVAPAPSLGGLHGALFGCADPGKLSPEERARCGSALAVPDDTVDFRDGVNRSRSAALWERGRERKNAPLLLPCMNPNGFSPLGTALCLAKTAVEGDFKADEQPGYADPQTVIHLPNNGDPPDHPTGF